MTWGFPGVGRLKKQIEFGTFTNVLLSGSAAGDGHLDFSGLALDQFQNYQISITNLVAPMVGQARILLTLMHNNVPYTGGNAGAGIGYYYKETPDSNAPAAGWISQPGTSNVYNGTNGDVGSGEISLNNHFLSASINGNAKSTNVRGSFFLDMPQWEIGVTKQASSQAYAGGGDYSQSNNPVSQKIFDGVYIHWAAPAFAEFTSFDWVLRGSKT